MLLRITDYKDIDERKLMDVYNESNFENTDYFYPNEKNKEVAVKSVEEGFLDYLKNDFFIIPGSTYWVLEENGVWISALRTNLISKGLYYIEALETRPDSRKKGYTTSLLNQIIETLKKEGPFRLCSCVSKKNEASLKVHQKCGFKIVSEDGYNYLLNDYEFMDYGLEYAYLG